MGTPEFAVPALKMLINSHHEIVAVYTAPPKAKGRHQKEAKTPIHELAESFQLEVEMPVSLRKEPEQDVFRSKNADLAVVAAYGLILPKAILEATKFGCFNIHPSSLPRFRGAAPIERMILAGDFETSSCIMQMDEGLDTGDILLQEKIPVSPKATSTEMHEILSNLGARMLLEALELLEKKQLKPVKQTNEQVVYAEKLRKEEARIDWSQSAEQIERNIRGLNPWPGCHFEFGQEKIKIHQASVKKEAHDHAPGKILSNDKTIEIACGSDILVIENLQRTGKNAMKTADFLRGFKMSLGEILPS